MPTLLLVLLIEVDKPDLILIFSRIQSLKLFDDDAYFQPELRERIARYSQSWTKLMKCFPSWTKFAKCFPSLTKIEIRVFWTDCSVPIIDIFLTGFAKLHLIIVEFICGCVASNPISRDHIIEKRRQSFGLHKNDEYKVNVTLEDDKLSIWIP